MLVKHKRFSNCIRATYINVKDEKQGEATTSCKYPDQNRTANISFHFIWEFRNSKLLSLLVGTRTTMLSLHVANIHIHAT